MNASFKIFKQQTQVSACESGHNLHHRELFWIFPLKMTLTFFKKMNQSLSS